MKEKDLLIEKISEADYVLIGLGEEFNEDFSNISDYPDIMDKLGEITNSEDISNDKKWMIPFLEKRYLDRQNDSDIISGLRNLYNLVKDKNYFVVTTCIDDNALKAGFDKEKFVAPCGGYHHMQCREKCTEELFDVASFENDINSEVEPVCPHCGKPLVFNNIICENYIEAGYLPQWEVYTKWLQNTLNRKLCVIELGVGLNLPSVIRSPFERVAFFNKKASFFRVNESLSNINDDLKDKGVSVEMNAVQFLTSI